MIVTVTHVRIPAMSTIGYAKGTDEKGDPVAFIGDHRPMRALGEWLTESEEPVMAMVEDYQVIPVIAFPVGPETPHEPC